MSRRKSSIYKEKSLKSDFLRCQYRKLKMGLEPTTPSLRVKCSTNWAISAIQAAQWQLNVLYRFFENFSSILFLFSTFTCFYSKILFILYIYVFLLKADFGFRGAMVFLQTSKNALNVDEINRLHRFKAYVLWCPSRSWQSALRSVVPPQEHYFPTKPSITENSREKLPLEMILLNNWLNC